MWERSTADSLADSQYRAAMAAAAASYRQTVHPFYDDDAEADRRRRRCDEFEFGARALAAIREQNPEEETR